MASQVLFILHWKRKLRCRGKNQTWYHGEQSKYFINFYDMSSVVDKADQVFGMRFRMKVDGDGERDLLPSVASISRSKAVTGGVLFSTKVREKMKNLGQVALSLRLLVNCINYVHLRPIGQTQPLSWEYILWLETMLSANNGGGEILFIFKKEEIMDIKQPSAISTIPVCGFLGFVIRKGDIHGHLVGSVC